MAVTINECVPPSTTSSKPKRDTVARVAFMKKLDYPRELWPFMVDMSIEKNELAAGFPEEHRDTRDVNLEDVRGLETKLSLKEQGFLYAYDDCPELQELDKCEGDADRIAALIIPANARLVKRLTGAEVVVPTMAGIVRNKTTFTKMNLSAPVREVHFDNGKWVAGKPAVHTYLTNGSITSKHPDAAKAMDLLQSPDYVVKIINVWRPLKTIHRDPLVVCDYTSIDKEKDMFPIRFLGPADSQVWWQRPRLLYNPAQKWQYLSAQEPTEPLVFTIYDESKEAEDPAFGLAHSAAIDHEYANDAWPMRHSLECRYAAFVHKTVA